MDAPDWVLVGLLALGVLTTAALVVARRRAPDREVDVDPLFLVGIPIAGAGAALIATLGPGALAMVAIGTVLMVVGAVRSRRGR